MVPAETVYPSTTSVVTTTDDSTDEWLSFGVGALAGGLLTAAIMWDDDDDWNDRLYYGGRGYYGGAGYWGGASYWNNNGWREPANINVDRSRDIQRNVERGDVTVNRGIVGNEVKRWEHNPERRGGVRYRDASTENRFAARRGEANINRDAARGRVGKGDRELKAPDLGAVRREGAASGGISKLAEGRDAAGRVGDRQTPGGDRQVRAPDRDQARDQVRREGAVGGRGEGVREQQPGGGEARAKAQARAPEARAKTQARAPAAAAKGKPRVQSAAATKRPVNREAQRPAADQVKRPEKAAARPQAQRPAATRASAPRSSAFQQASRSNTARAASNRGGASRASAGGRASGGGRSGGGSRRR